jgi:hypothetical protein
MKRRGRCFISTFLVSVLSNAQRRQPSFTAASYRRRKPLRATRSACIIPTKTDVRIAGLEMDVHNLPNILEEGETLDKVMEAAREWLVGKEVELLVMEEEAKAKNKRTGFV